MTRHLIQIDGPSPAQIDEYRGKGDVTFDGTVMSVLLPDDGVSPPEPMLAAPGTKEFLDAMVAEGAMTATRRDKVIARLKR